MTGTAGRRLSYLFDSRETRRGRSCSDLAKAGRRYLSEDLADLDLLAAEVAGQVERLRQERQHRLLAEAELETLRAQINPHFLFNALNALYGVIPRAAANARETLLNLADIFRYALGGKRQFVSLEEELRIVEAYLQIERLRLGDRLSTRIELDDDARPLQVPALSIQPLVDECGEAWCERQARGWGGAGPRFACERPLVG